MNPSTHEVTGISIPYLLTLLTHHDLDTSITGMNDIPQDERPPILPVFYSFHLMILIGCALAALFLAGLWGVEKEAGSSRSAGCSGALFSPYWARK